MNSKYALVLAVVLGVVAAFAVHQYIDKIQEDVRLNNRPVPVVFAKEDIQASTQVREESLEPKDWPFHYLTEQIVPWDQRDKVIGKVAYARWPKGPSGKRTTSIWNWGFPINAAQSDKKKKATWLFIQWAASAETD